MNWIKRNLFFSIGGLIALLLLAAAGWYDWSSWSHNSTSFDKLNEIYNKLNELNNRKPSYGGTKLDNTKTAREQERELRKWIEGADGSFQPIEPIPTAPVVTSETFAGDLRRTIDLLQHRAEDASVQLPPKYGFAFEAERQTMRFTPAGLNPLAQQLGAVKKISAVLFAAKINSLDGIQRVRVSPDDLQGPAADYLNEDPVTNNFAILTPYAVTFRSFTPELAAVLAGFASSPHGMIVTEINVAPAAAAQAAQTAATPGNYPGGPGNYPPGYQGGTYPGGYPGMPAPTTAPVFGGRGGLPTVLKEQLLRITLKVVIVKPLLKK